MIAFRGVRSSWLIVAMNWIFAASARSDSARAVSIARSCDFRSLISRRTAMTSRSPAPNSPGKTAHVHPSKLAGAAPDAKLQ